MSGVTELLDDHGFRTGLLVGVILTILVIALALVSTSGRRRPSSSDHQGSLPVGGFALAGGVLFALERAGWPVRPTSGLVVAVAVLAAGPLLVSLVPALAERSRLASLFEALAAFPGALLVARAAAPVNDRAWVLVAVVATTVVGGALARGTDRTTGTSGIGPSLFALTAVGMYVTLPDTELARVAVGVALPLAIIGLPRVWATLGPGVFAAIGLLAWIAAVDGVGRAGSVVGALAGFGVLVLLPLVQAVVGPRTRLPSRPREWRVPAILALQAAVVAGTARWAGLRTGAAGAAITATIVLVAGALALGILLAPWPGHRSQVDPGDRRRARRTIADGRRLVD